jgi:hypothetical protein
LEAGVTRFQRLLCAVIAVLVLVPLGFSSAANVYITPNGSPQGNCTTTPQTPAWFSNSANWGTGASQIGPATKVLVCGTFTGASNSTLLAFQGNGSSGSPITLTFDKGTVLEAPYWASSEGGTAAGAVTCGSHSWIVIDGANTGTIENTANGSSLANQQPSTGVSCFGSNNIIKNLTISNLYVQVAPSATLGDNSVIRALDVTGQNVTLQGNTIHDCGWCIIDSYANGDTNLQILKNNIYNMGHAVAFAASNAVTCTAPCLIMDSNHIHDAANWSAAGCPFHQDGLHIFGVPAGNSIDGVYVSNNLFDGDWGTCPTGFVFVEAGGGGSPANLKSSYWWNNVMVVVNPGFVNTNGWFGVSSGVSGSQLIFNNTIVGLNATDNSLCFNMQGLSGLSFENNVASPCGDPVQISNSTLVTTNYNFYGPSCQNGNNCFIWNGAFTGSFSSWKSACSCDGSAVQNSTAAVNLDGSLQSGSPAIGMAANLMGAATGSMASLASDTTEGGTRTPLLRAASGRWTAGAYNLGSGTAATAPAPAPPSDLQVTVQ